jgi:hypothetical protein
MCAGVDKYAAGATQTAHSTKEQACIADLGRCSRRSGVDRAGDGAFDARTPDWPAPALHRPLLGRRVHRIRSICERVPAARTTWEQ